MLCLQDEIYMNRPFPGSLGPPFQNKSKCETFHMKMSSACSFIFMQIKAIFIGMISHLDSLWNRGTRELENGLAIENCSGRIRICSVRVLALGNALNKRTITGFKVST